MSLEEQSCLPLAGILLHKPKIRRRESKVMIRRAVFTACGVILVLSALSLAGCEDSAGGLGGDEVEPVAFLIEDGATKYYKHQAWCPVCDKRPLHQSHYVDVEGKRIYFNSEECVKEFENDQSTYLSKFKEQIETAKGSDGIWFPGMNE